MDDEPSIREMLQAHLMLAGHACLCAADAAEARCVMLDGVPVALTALEFDLLALLVRRRDAALTREALLHQVWGYQYTGETRTVDVHIQRLRHKLGADAIETVY